MPRGVGQRYTKDIDVVRGGRWSRGGTREDEALAVMRGSVEVSDAVSSMENKPFQ